MEDNTSKNVNNNNNDKGSNVLLFPPCVIQMSFLNPGGTLNALLSTLNFKINALSFTQCAEFCFVHYHFSHN